MMSPGAVDVGRERFRCEPYAARATVFDGVIELHGWRLKRYTVRLGEWACSEAFDEAMDIAWRALPRPASDALRPGVGFVIRHEGRRMRYLVLCWWDNENELPLRIWVQPVDGDMAWRRAGERESICVWDMRVLDGERRAYVEHVLGRAGGPDLDAYLAASALADASA